MLQTDLRLRARIANALGGTQQDVLLLAHREFNDPVVTDVLTRDAAAFVVDLAIVYLDAATAYQAPGFAVRGGQPRLHEGGQQAQPSLHAPGADVYGWQSGARLALFKCLSCRVFCLERHVLSVC